MNQLQLSATPAQRVIAVACLFVLTMAGGTLGFYLIEGQPLFDCFYMVVITLTTVGYGEVIELSQAGKLFNSALILTGFMIVFLGLGVLADVVVSLELRNYFDERKNKRLIDSMKGHYIVCGLGQVGRAVIHHLQRTGAPFVAIDVDEAHKAWARANDVALVTADATLDDTLERAGAARARGLIAAVRGDAENVYITLSALMLNPDIHIVARARGREASKKLRLAGAHTVFRPHAFTGYRLAQAALHPQVSQFLEIASAIEASDIDIGEYHVAARSSWDGDTVGAYKKASERSVIVLALTRPGESMRFNPPSDTPLAAGDVLIVMGPCHALDEARHL